MISTMAARTNHRLLSLRIPQLTPITLKNRLFMSIKPMAVSSGCSAQTASLSTHTRILQLPSRSLSHRQISRPSIVHSQTRASSSYTPPEKPDGISAKVDTLIELAKNRRTYYRLGGSSPVPDSKIEEIVQSAILHIPSAFNTQSTRLIVLLREEHGKLWDIVISTFGELVKTGTIPEDVWRNQTKPKFEGFKAGYGTVLFFEDPAHIAPLSEKAPLYKDKFGPWAEHSNAMHQWFLWTALEGLGFGANLQHYNPVIDAPIAKEWNIPSDWRLIAQLVFGSIEAPVGQKQQLKPLEERLAIYGSK